MCSRLSTSLHKQGATSTKHWNVSLPATSVWHTQRAQRATPTPATKGYAQMAHLVCQWLEETPLPPPEGSGDAHGSSSTDEANEATFLRVRINPGIIIDNAYQHT